MFLWQSGSYLEARFLLCGQSGDSMWNMLLCSCEGCRGIADMFKMGDEKDLYEYISKVWRENNIY